MVAQGPLEAFVMVRIHVGQPLRILTSLPPITVIAPSQGGAKQVIC